MLASSLVSLICGQVLLAQGSYAPACANAASALLITSGIKSDFDLVEHRTQAEIQKHVPQELNSYAAVGAMLYRRSVTYSFRVAPMSANLGISASENVQSLSVSWTF